MSTAGAHAAGSAPTVRLDADAVLRIAADPHRSFSEQAEVIAYAYHQLARGLAQEVGPADANWFCFAGWTSKAIGESLNLGPASPFWGNLARRLRVPAAFRRSFRWVMIVLLGRAYLQGLSLANRSIFLEMGTFAADLWTPEPRDGYKVAPHDRPAQVFVSSLLQEADPEYLEVARRLLAEARATGDGALRTELILGANLALSAFEQARAQKVLEFVLYRPIRWLFRVWWRVVLHWLTPWREFHRFALYAEPHDQQPPLVGKVEDWWARRYTRRILALETPIGEVAVGAPLSPPDGFDAGAVPPPFRNQQVERLVDRFARPAHAGDLRRRRELAVVRGADALHRLLLPPLPARPPAVRPALHRGARPPAGGDAGRRRPADGHPRRPQRHRWTPDPVVPAPTGGRPRGPGP